VHGALTARRCTGVILAGGRASRFAERPKGLELVGGARILDRVADSLARVCDDLLLVANAANAAEWLPGVPTVPDTLADRGPLGGVATALRQSASSVLVLAWDMPFVPVALCAALRSAGESAAVEDGALVVAPWSGAPAGGEPLCAYYAADSRDRIEMLLADGAHPAAHRVFSALPTRILSRAEVAAYGDPDIIFMSVNTPTDLHAARLIADRATTEPSR
jgi:molybdopterin-guanine dinucleotide biosynthesis protein A